MRPVYMCLREACRTSAVNNNYYCCTLPARKVGSSRMFSFFQFEYNSEAEIGLKWRDGKFLKLKQFEPNLPSDLVSALQSPFGMDYLKELCKRCLNAVEKGDVSKGVLLLEDVKLLAPIKSPDKVLAVGLNYLDHCIEMNVEPPKEPLLFNKFPSCIIKTGSIVNIPKHITQKLDWEVELVIVIGREASCVSEVDAMDYIFGYAVANDLSARDVQQSLTLLQAKSMDQFCPLGPYVVTKESVDVDNLRMKTVVNGVVMQDSSTSQMIFKPAQLLSYISRFFTLLPGDMILTGTPPGVGTRRNPPLYIKAGDEVEVSIEELGSCSTTFS